MDIFKLCKRALIKI